MSRNGMFVATPRLRRARARAGVSLVGFARTCGVSKGMLSKIERAERHLTPERARAIAEALGTDLDAALSRGWFKWA